VAVLDEFDPEIAKYLKYYLKIWGDKWIAKGETKG